MVEIGKVFVTKEKILMVTGFNTDVISQTEARINDWECSINESIILCKASKGYLDGKHSIRYEIYPDGLAKLTLDTPKIGSRVIKKSFVMDELIVIALPGGDIDQRYPYCIKHGFYELLNKYGITEVINEDPNREYECDLDITIESDGEILDKSVCKATWTIITKKHWNEEQRSFSRILYTLHPITTLNLPPKEESE